MRVRFILLLSYIFLFSCSIEQVDKEDSPIPLTVTGEQGEPGVSVDFYDNEDGSTTFITYLDSSGNYQYDLGETWFKKKIFYPAVDGQDGADAIQVVTLQETFVDSEGRQCVSIITFHDLNDNGQVDNDEEIDFENTICGGLDGTSGENGRSIISVTREATEEECINGGSVIILSYETGENISNIIVCNGSDGSSTNGEDGMSSMVITEVIEEGEICKHGGIRIITMNDKNRDGNFDDQGEIQETILCRDKCVHEEECEYEVFDTVECDTGRRYSIWIDGTYFSNISLKFRNDDNGTVSLYGKVARHGDDDLFTVDVVFTEGKEDKYKNPRCIEDFDNSNWIQYTSLEGTITSDYKGTVYQLSRRGEAGQLGVGANVTNKDLRNGFSMWGKITNHNNCKMDFNFNLECR